MPPVILIVGCTGAGKTTYARTLANKIGALRFSIDEWMGPLFGPDMPEPVMFEWMMERINRCESLIFTLVQQATARDLPVILDLGFTKRQHRDKFRKLSAEIGLGAAVHFVDVNPEIRWHRVQMRNEQQGETYAMRVDRAMFEFMENMWEPPTVAEWEIGGGCRITS